MLAASVRLALLAAALGSALAAQARLAERPTATAPAQPTPVRTELARAAALGFDSLAADYLWLRAVQRVGSANRDPSQDADELAWLIDTATSLDPFVDHPYRFAALWLSDRPESVRTANRLLERGIAYHPTDWRNRFYLAFNHFFHLGDSEAAARELERAIALPGAPDYLGRLLARLHADAGGLELAEAFLRSLLQQTEDAYLRAGYEKSLREIETERRARWLDQARAMYRERHGRDIERVEDLLRVVEALPPEPNRGAWVLDETGRIVSSQVGRRYELHFHPADRERREAAQRRAQEES